MKTVQRISHINWLLMTGFSGGGFTSVVRSGSECVCSALYLGLSLGGDFHNPSV